MDEFSSKTVSEISQKFTNKGELWKNISEPKAETIKILKNRLKNEIELYNFVKDLFYVKLKSFNAELNL